MLPKKLKQKYRISQVQELKPIDNQLEPFQWFADMRKETPIRYDQKYATWDVFDYKHAREVLSSHSIFKFDTKSVSPIIKENITGLNPPRHTKIRNIVSGYFQQKMMEHWSPAIDEIISTLISSKRADNTFDLVSDLGYRVPILCSAQMMGIPQHQVHYIEEWANILNQTTMQNTPQSDSCPFHTFIAANNVYNMARFSASIYKLLRGRKKIVALFKSLIEKRMSSDSGNDIISYLLHTEINGYRMNQNEIIDFLFQLILVGNGTTTHLITNSVRCMLDENLMARLQQDNSLFPTFIEEVLRYRSPKCFTWRYASETCQLGGHHIKKGDQIVVWLASSNRDEEVFEQANQFIPDRTPNRHLAFGIGLHYCIGASLARTQTQLVLQALLKEMKNLRYSESFRPEPAAHLVFHSYRSLKLDYTT